MLVPLVMPAAAAAAVVDAVDEEQVEDGVEDGGGRTTDCFSVGALEVADGGVGLNLRPAIGESRDVSYQSFSFFFCEWSDVIDTLLDIRV